MSAIMYERAVNGTTTGLRIVTDSGDEIDYSSGRGLTMAIEDSPIFAEGQAEGAVVAMLSIDDFKDQNLVQVDSPQGQGDLVTIERTIALLSEVRARTTADGGNAMSVHVAREAAPFRLLHPHLAIGRGCPRQEWTD
jgi:hypothetical protein